MIDETNLSLYAAAAAWRKKIRYDSIIFFFFAVGHYCTYHNILYIRAPAGRETAQFEKRSIFCTTCEINRRRRRIAVAKIIIGF